MNKEIHSSRVSRGSRTYFFDIKKSKNDHLYLLVSESRKNRSGSEHHRLMVFEEDLDDFAAALKESLLKFRELKVCKPSIT